MKSIKFTSDHVRQAVGQNAFVRGKTMFTNGHILQSQLLNTNDPCQNNYQGVVRGSKGGSYKQDILIEIRADSDHVDIDGDCTCPVSYNCKHVAALLLKALDSQQAQQEKVRKPTKQQQQQAWQQWQQSRKNDLLAHQQKEQISGFNSVLLFELVWRDYQGHLRFSADIHSARRLKKGGFGKSSRASVYDNFYYYSTQEKSIAKLLELLSGHSIVPVIAGEEGALVLRKMLATERLFSLTVEGKPRYYRQGDAIELAFAWHETKTNLELQMSAKGLSDNWLILPTQPPFYVDTENFVIGAVANSVNVEDLMALRTMPSIPQKSAIEALEILHEVLPAEQIPIPKNIPVTRIAQPPQPVLTLTRKLGPRAKKINCLEVSFDYPPIEVTHEAIFNQSAQAQNFIQLDGQNFQLSRDLPAEQQALTQLKSHACSLVDVGEDVLVVLGDARIGYESMPLWDQFINQGIEQLEQAGWVVIQSEDFSLTIDDVEQWHWNLDEQNSDWFSLAIDVEIDGQQIDLLPALVETLASGVDPQQMADTVLIPVAAQKFIRVPSELIKNLSGLLEEWYDSHHDALRIPKFAVGSVADQDIPWSAMSELKSLAKKLAAGPGKLKPPRTLQAQLRPYQQQGFEWLQHLRKLAMNGILADDMGLGKTMQTLAFILKEKEARRLKSPALIIAPTSLVGNWRNEVERFAPSLKTLVLHGPNRHELFDQIASSDLVITTYPLIARDDALLAQQFYLLVLDEAQTIKNPKTKVAKTVRDLSAEHRFCLTGTPMENHLGELWALFDFLMPGFLHSEKKFNQVYRNPIEKDASITKQQQLHQRITPFMLRRTKQQVAQELPAKTEIIHRISLEKQQAALYETVRIAMEKRIRNLMQAKGLNRSHIEMLDALLKLRQVCCDPQLVKLERAKKVKQSAKMDALMELLPEMVEEGRKILVFSQFTEMLSLIEKQLQKNKIDYVKLTGQTRKRQSVIDAFAQGEVPVFLISLKAGGVGLNLTAADTVIHYDPWWNPAVENQATDRAHRIGQDKPVFVYKLICEKTVEEKILDMQKQKQALADAVYQSDKQGAQLDSEQWLALFDAQ